MTKSGVQQWLNLPDYNEARVDRAKDFEIAVNETTNGAKADEDIALGASGNNYTNATPFPGVLRLTFNADSSETDLLNRYRCQCGFIWW